MLAPTSRVRVNCDKELWLVLSGGWRTLAYCFSNFQGFFCFVTSAGASRVPFCVCFMGRGTALAQWLELATASQVFKLYFDMK